MSARKRHPTWKPENPATPWLVSDYTATARRRREKLIAKRKKKYGKVYVAKFGRPADKLHHGPCKPTWVTVYQPSLAARIFRREKPQKRLIAGKGHLIVSFDRFGNRMWHPRYADVKICLVCRMVLKRTHGTREGAA